MLPANIRSKRNGFTLIEILIVIAIIAILSGVMLMVINPARHLAQSRNAHRKVDLHALSMAIYRYTLDMGRIPAGITQVETEICHQNAPDCTGYVDLSVLLNREEFLSKIPEDPNNDSAQGIGYSIFVNEFGSVTVRAPMAELGEEISIKQ